MPLSGILNIDKPGGITSHDVVDAVRRMAGQRRVGHAGTLDPMATGVLLVCLGSATRITEYLMTGEKRYRATVVLGVSTDTYDAEGAVVTSGGRSDFVRAEIEAGLAGFVGTIEQVPPIYSSVKSHGQPLHRLARRGVAVSPQPRRVEIRALTVIAWSPPALVVEVTCSPGTYVRSIAHDFGKRMESGAYLSALVRLSSGHFSLQDAVSLDRLEEAFRAAEEERYLLPLDEALLAWPALVVGARDAHSLVCGQTIPVAPADRPANPHQLYRAYSIAGDFVAILGYDPDADQWRPRKVFVTERDECRL